MRAVAATVIQEIRAGEPAIGHDFAVGVVDTVWALRAWRCNALCWNRRGNIVEETIVIVYAGVRHANDLSCPKDAVLPHDVAVCVGALNCERTVSITQCYFFIWLDPPHSGVLCNKCHGLFQRESPCHLHQHLSGRHKLDVGRNLHLRESAVPLHSHLICILRPSCSSIYEHGIEGIYVWIVPPSFVFVLGWRGERRAGAIVSLCDLFRFAGGEGGRHVLHKIRVDFHARRHLVNINNSTVFPGLFHGKAIHSHNKCIVWQVLHEAAVGKVG